MPIFNWLLIDSAIEVGDNKLLPAGEREVADILSVGVSVLFTEWQICGCIIYTSLIFIYIAGLGDAIHNGTMAIQAPSWTRFICIGQCTFVPFGKMV